MIYDLIIIRPELVHQVFELRREEERRYERVGFIRELV